MANLVNVLQRPSASEHVNPRDLSERKVAKNPEGPRKVGPHGKDAAAESEHNAEQFDSKLSQAMNPAQEPGKDASVKSAESSVGQKAEAEAAKKGAESNAQQALQAMMAKPTASTLSLKETAEAAAKGAEKNSVQKNQAQVIASDPQAVQMNKLIAEMKAAESNQSEQAVLKTALKGPKSEQSAAQIQDAFSSQAGTALMSGMDLSALSEKHEFEIDEVNTDSIAPKETPVKAAASPLTTSDFLNLRTISKDSAKDLSKAKADSISLPQNAFAADAAIPVGASALKMSQRDAGLKDGKKLKLETAALAGQTSAFAEHVGSGQKVIDAPVTQGSSNKAVLTHDTIQQLTQSVNLMSQARQDGEIKIRLRPDHLGELQMKVKTQGQQVSIEIHAQNGEAKKIIEESMNSLRESLSEQNLTLGRVDVVTQPTSAANADASQQFDNSQARQNFDSSAGSFAQGSRDERGSRQDRSFEDESSRSNLVRMGSIANSNRARSAQGLDLIA